MEAEISFPPKPAQLMRRMAPRSEAAVPTISRDAGEPMLRFQVEMTRGSLVVQLAPAPAGGEDVAIQWTQNGTPIKGETGTALHLAALTADDGDVYYALLRSASGETRSQSFLVVVVSGNPLLNFSMRGLVVGSAKPLIAGFVVGRAAGPIKNKRYLIRVVGTSLRRFGVTETLSHPVAALHRGKVKYRELVQSDEQIALAREWEPKVGAFALEANATEIVGVVDLPPGPYSLVVTGGEGESGEVLLEIYEIPG